MEQMTFDFDQLPLIESEKPGKFSYSEVFKAWKNKDYRRYNWAYFRWFLDEFRDDYPTLSENQIWSQKISLLECINDLGGLSSAW